MNEGVNNNFLLINKQSPSSKPFRHKRTSSERAGLINAY